MWRAAVLVGRSLADLSTAALCALIVALTGLVIGWWPDASIPAVIGGFALFLLFSYALSWGCGCLGIVSKGPSRRRGSVSSSSSPWPSSPTDWSPPSACPPY